MKLRALRCAAMISTMTFNDLVGHHEHHCGKFDGEVGRSADEQSAVG